MASRSIPSLETRTFTVRSSSNVHPSPPSSFPLPLRRSHPHSLTATVSPPPPSLSLTPLAMSASNSAASPTELNDEPDFDSIVSPDGLISICGFGSLLSEKSARSTFPDLKNFRVAALRGFRRVFAHVAPIFFERGIAIKETGEISSLSVEPCDGECIIVTVFEISRSLVPAFMEREHEFRFLAVVPEDLNGTPFANPAVDSRCISPRLSLREPTEAEKINKCVGSRGPVHLRVFLQIRPLSIHSLIKEFMDKVGRIPYLLLLDVYKDPSCHEQSFYRVDKLQLNVGMVMKLYLNRAPTEVLCARFTDDEYFRIRCRGSKEIFFQRYGKYNIHKIWRDDILPCRIYLRHCVLAAKNLGKAAYDNFLDHTFISDRKTTIRVYLGSAGVGIMEEEPPESLKSRYGG